MRAAAAQSARLHFAPGTRTEYSSTNYVLAGLVLLAHSPQAEGDWRRLELLELAIPPARRAAYAHMRFVNAAPISSVATLAGASSFIPGSLTPIWAQSGSILGWTCGNLAASPIDVATFYRDLLVYLPYISPISPLYLPYLSPISPLSLPYLSHRRRPLLPPLAGRGLGLGEGLGLARRWPRTAPSGFMLGTTWKVYTSRRRT